MKFLRLSFVLVFAFLNSFGQHNDYPVTGSITINDYSPRVIFKRNTDEGGFIQGIQTQFVNGNNNWFFGNVYDYSWVVSKSDYSNPLFTILSNGSIGMGTSIPSEKLEVNGKIRAKEIKVEISGWPDYVFSSSYKKMPLLELEKFIQKNGHLPEIPSAKEVELNGVELGEMNKLLLKKIEELTLHLIEQGKEIEDLKKKVNKE